MAKSTKKVNTEFIKDSFNLDPAIPWQLKYIATMDSTTKTDIVNTLLLDYIKKWEGKNGQIPPKK